MLLRLQAAIDTQYWQEYCTRYCVRYRVRYWIRYIQSDIQSCTDLQIDFINSEIRAAKKGNLHGKPLIENPMESIVEAHVSMLEWHVQSRKFGMTAVQLELLQQKSI